MVIRGLMLFVVFIVFFIGCGEKPPGPELKKVLFIRGDVLVSSQLNKTFISVCEGQILSNKDIITVAEEAQCRIAVGRDTLIAGGGSRINVSSRINGKIVLVKVVVASGNVFFSDHIRDPIPRQILFATTDASGFSTQGSFVIEKRESITQFRVFSGSVMVKSKITQDSIRISEGEGVMVIKENGIQSLVPISEADQTMLRKWLGSEIADHFMGKGKLLEKNGSNKHIETSKPGNIPLKKKLKASAGHNIEAFVNEKVFFKGQGKAASSNIISYEWDFDNDGKVDYESDSTGNIDYTYTTSGTYNAVFKVYSDDGRSALSTLRVNIKDRQSRK